MSHNISNEAEKHGNGNREKIRQAYISLFTDLCRFAVRKGVNEEDARDIVSEVFLKMLQNPESIKNYESLPSFLNKSVNNGCMDYFKHNKIIREHEEYVCDHKDFFQQIDNETPLYLLISKETEIEILDAIDKLPPKCGKILIDRLEGLSYQEIADSLGITVRTVRNQISIGTNKLRKYFEKNKN